MNSSLSAELSLKGSEPSSLVAKLLDARTACAAAGNRRALFARMDEILEGQISSSGMAHLTSSLIHDKREAVRLTRLRLRNWKAFEKADLVFADNDAGKQLFIVRGANGFGKSSILEAYALTLFGQRAFSEIGFLISGAGKRSDQRRSYRSMVEQSLHRSARALDEGISSVILDFDGADGPLSIERKWYFDERGCLIEEDEELVLRVGAERRPLQAPEQNNVQEWCQAEIERRVMPAEISPFFLFDGEQIDRWAERELSQQVRQALTRMLGLADVSGLAQDLLDFARDRERGSAPDGFSEIQRLDEQVARLSRSVADDDARLQETEVSLNAARCSRQATLSALTAIDIHSHADVQVELETQHRLAADRERLQRDLINIMADDGPMIFAGESLLTHARARVEAEREADGVRLQHEEIAHLWHRFELAGPKLKSGEIERLRDRFERACAGSTDADDIDIRHKHLNRDTRKAVVDRLDRALRTGGSRVSQGVLTVRAIEAERDRSLAASMQHQQDHERVEQHQRELSQQAETIATLENHQAAILMGRAESTAELEPLQARLETMREAMVQAEPRLRAAEKARGIATSILAQIDEAADSEHARFAQAVTASFRSLSHKDQIARIDITREGSLRMLDRKGADITDYRLSAGETQLFAMALVMAVGSLIGDRLPLVIDTPLGRLDTEHRQRVLDLLARRSAQTIMLTQPAELHSAHLERIRNAVADTIHLAHHIDENTGIGVSMVGPQLDQAAA